MNSLKWYWPFLSWLIACIASTGSLFFSEVMEFVPCSLCWYQRICMYPLAVILLVGIIKNDLVGATTYSLPFSFLGLFLALYHNLIQWEFISEGYSPCVQGIPCSSLYIQWGGFITIPVLSLTAFSLITAIIFAMRFKLMVPLKENKKGEN